ncbi:MAG: hypothetical protein AB1512_27815 [Thermodesulfobacteriota bacterium]
MAVNNQHVLDVLFGQSNALWRYETRHEALLLLQALYAKAAELRDMLCERIVAGPPVGVLGPEVRQEDIDRAVFDILSSLQSKGMPLSSAGQKRLKGIREDNPTWMYADPTEISAFIERGRVARNVDVESVKTLEPQKVADAIRSCQPERKTSLRDRCESIGVRIAQEPKWGLTALAALGEHVGGLPEGSLNSILWGIRASLTDKSSKLDRETGKLLIDVLGELIARLPSPKAWSSLPSILNDLADKLELDAAVWDPLGQHLQKLFENFDYDRPEEERPVEWLQRVINHPYGDLAQLYLKLAQREVNSLSSSGLPLALNMRCSQFLAAMSDTYGKGSRYGYCLVAEHLAWMEAVSPEYAEIMRNWFEWGAKEDRALVTWSGYLWSRVFSRVLVEQFESTYLPTALRYKQFGESERRGLASHIAAVLWFDQEMFPHLKRVASAVDAGLRLDILGEWKNHLQNANPDSAERFFHKVVFPFWEWCSCNDFFIGDDGNRERFAFWMLLPYSNNAFPEASRRAIDLKPSKKLESTHWFIRALTTESMLKYPNELVELLLVLSELDPYPHLEDKEWRAIWNKLKDKGPKRLNDLENALARRDVALRE